MGRRLLSLLGSIAGAVALAALVLLTGSCGTGAPGPLAELMALPDAPTVVVFVPGTTGTELRDRETGELIWGSGQALLRPRDGGYSLALPLAPDDPRRQRLEPGALLHRLSLFGILNKAVYGPVLGWLEDHGYPRGDLETARPGERLFSFAYDWRRSNVDSARTLARRLAELRRDLAQPQLQVALICQSNGASICRYLMKYGDAGLAAAAAGEGAPPEGIRFTRLVLVGTANGGSLRVLRLLDRGRTYLSPVGRHWSAEALFTFPGLYQDLPAYNPRPFVDEDGNELADDIFDPQTWRRFELGIYRPEVQRRLLRVGDEDLFGDAAARDAYLERVLAEARQFHRLLRRDPEGYDPPPIYLIQNIYTPTAHRALVTRRRDGGWRALYTGDRALAGYPALRSRLSAPGDEHATQASQLWLSPRELEAVEGEPLYIRGGHFEMILHPAAKRRLTEILKLEPSPEAGSESAPASTPDEPAFP
jgi:hypothetical protein